MNASYAVLAAFALFVCSIEAVDKNKYTLHTKRCGAKGMRGSSAEQASNACFNEGQNTYVIIHGWNGWNGKWMAKVARAILTEDPKANAFVVNWKETGAGLGLFQAQAATQEAADEICRFIQTLEKIGQERSKVQLIGHSLGGMVSGRVGCGSCKGIGKIVGLDTAEFAGGRVLNSGCANFVQEIHTKISKIQKGHADFFINGCPLESRSRLCNHGAAANYYLATITNRCLNNYQAKACASYQAYKAGTCDANISNNMGWRATKPSSSTKNFYVDIGEKFPYCSKMKWHIFNMDTE